MDHQAPGSSQAKGSPFLKNGSPTAFGSSRCVLSGPLAIGALLYWAAAASNCVAEEAEYENTVINRKNPPETRAPHSPSQGRPAASPAEDSNLKLTGILNLAGDKLAYFTVERQGQARQLLRLSEGEEEGSIKVIAINAKDRSVEALYRGEYLKLTFDSHGRDGSGSYALKEFIGNHVQAHEQRQEEERVREAHEAAVAQFELTQERK